MSKRAIIACDPGAVSLKDSVKAHLEERGYEVDDVGSTVEAEVPYYEAGRRVGEAVSEKKYKLGFVLCGSGMGVNLVANMFPGVFCAVCESIYSAKLSRAVNDANVLAMGSNLVAPHLANKMVDAFLDTRFLIDYPDGDPEFLGKAVEIIRGYEKDRYR